MAVVTIVENEPLASGDYKVTVVNTELETGQYGTQIKFTFDVNGTEGRQLMAWASCTGSMGGKLYLWARAFGWEGEAGDTLNTDDLIGRTAVASVSVKPKKTDPTVLINKIESIRPVKKKSGEKKPDPFEEDEE